MYINDVGQQTWEEINGGKAGANYGWPEHEGPEGDPRYREPLFAYRHGNTGTTGCAITGGAFYRPATVAYPRGYVDDYFFADFCGGWIRRYDPATHRATAFATGLRAPVDLQVSRDGTLHYLSRGTGAVYKIRHTG